jgi:hypothetical protein
VDTNKDRGACQQDDLIRVKLLHTQLHCLWGARRQSGGRLHKRQFAGRGFRNFLSERGQTSSLSELPLGEGASGILGRN